MPHVGKFEYRRVSKKQTCPICGHDSWCMISVDKSFVICPRIADGSIKSYSFGYLHVLDDSIQRITKLPKRHKPRTPWDFTKEYSQLSDNGLTNLAYVLGVKEDALNDLGAKTKSGKTPCWAFPMRNADKQIIGLKYRNLHRSKWCSPGSRLGLYIPYSFDFLAPVFIAEGESDTAALLSLGYNAVGRPSVKSGTKILCKLFGKTECYIFADTDTDKIGLKEAYKLQMHLGDQAQIVYNPKHKDVREWIQSESFDYTNHIIERK